jgi:CheY-like chemotaxis protein
MSAGRSGLRSENLGITAAADGDAAVDLVAAVRPQVALMDLNMPGCDGVAATRRITAENPGTRVVVLTTYADGESIISARPASRTGRSRGRCSSVRPQSRLTSTGSSPRPAHETARRHCATPTPMATPSRNESASVPHDPDYTSWQLTSNALLNGLVDGLPRFSRDASACPYGYAHLCEQRHATHRIRHAS